MIRPEIGRRLEDAVAVIHRDAVSAIVLRCLVGHEPVERKVGSKVRVCGVTYRSVAAAFKALNLNFNAHQKFRYELKRSQNGKLEFGGYTFEVVA